MKVHLRGKGVHELKERNGSWSVTVDGRHYCAPTKQLLIQGLKRMLSFDEPREEPRAIPPFEYFYDLLTLPSSPLTARQLARRRLMEMATIGDSLAQEVVRKMNEKPEPSLEARNVTREIGKPDFSDVTHEELVEYVHNIVLRNKLIHELSERVRA